MDIDLLKSSSPLIPVHIRMNVVSLTKDSESERNEKLFQILDDEGFNPSVSRALVFVDRRALAEELARTLNEGLRQPGRRADYFHAGMTSAERRSAYTAFREGGTTVLCATKAFGLGMDIPNVHVVVHFRAPGSLEDYVQEIGRAGRDGRTSHAYVILGPNDFSRALDRLTRSFLSQLDLQHLHHIVIDEHERTRNTTSDAHKFFLSLDRVASAWRRENASNTDVRLRLYWLEALGRIRLGDLRPGSIDLAVLKDWTLLNSASVGKGPRQLGEYLNSKAQKRFPHRMSLLLSEAIANLKAVDLPNSDKVYDCLRELVRVGYVSLQRNLLLRSADRNAELNSMSGTFTPPRLLAALSLIDWIRDQFDEDASTKRFGVRELEGILRKEAEASEVFHPDQFPWLGDELQRQAGAAREVKSIGTAVWPVLKLLRALGLVENKLATEEGKAIRSLALRYQGDWFRQFEVIPDWVMAVLTTISFAHARNEEAFEVNAGDLLSHRLLEPNTLTELPTVSQIEAILRFLRDLGYLDAVDKFMPVEYEVELLHRDGLDLNVNGKDSDVLRQFDEQKRLRRLRLAALETVVEITKTAPEQARSLVTNYFDQQDREAVQKLLSTQLGKGHPILRRLLEEALDELVLGGGADPDKRTGGLTEEQRQVYDAQLDHNLLVVAGPGSGKTHVLLARLLRLVHVEHVAPRKILVLAFTRAVVSELQHRLRDYSQRLGYNTLARDVRIRTFHSFAMSVLRENGAVVTPREELISQVVEHLRSHPQTHRTLSDRFDFVFVDEFQDVHGDRQNLLSQLTFGPTPAASQRSKVRILAVGDDDQSIFEYDNFDKAMDSVKRMEDFERRFHATKITLTTNFRSTQQIIDANQQYLAALRGRIKNRERLVTGRIGCVGFAGEAPSGSNIVNVVSETLELLRAIPLTQRRRRPSPSGSDVIDNTVAVLGRTNADVYRVREEIQSSFGSSCKVLVQGDESRFEMRRDVIESLEKLASLKPAPTVPTIQSALRSILTTSPINKWHSCPDPNDHELLALAQDFRLQADPDSTTDDFVDYVREMSNNGNYLRVYIRYMSERNPNEDRMILSSIHKVKGLEFPAVVMLPSLLGVDDIDSEQRVSYVGGTRAEDVLVLIAGEREDKLLRREPYQTPDRQLDGIGVEPKLSDLLFSSFAYNEVLWTRDPQALIRGMRTGDEVVVKRNRGSNNPFGVWLPNGKALGLLASHRNKGSLASKLDRSFPNSQQFGGLTISGIYRRRVVDDPTTEAYIDRLHPDVLKLGYFYVPEIAGFARPLDGG